MKRALLLLLVACGGSSPKPAAPPANQTSPQPAAAKAAGDPCVAAAEHEAQMRVSAQNPKPHVDQVAIDACHDDHWPASATDCMITAADDDAFEACLTADVMKSYSAHAEPYAAPGDDPPPPEEAEEP